jgi:hypothetical protein
MAQSQYKLYKIQIDGDQDYIAGVTTCLDLIESVADGKKLLAAITTLSHQVFIQDTLDGNSCGAQSWSAFPPLPVAIKDKNTASFTTELKAAVDKAKSGGITLEHLGRQLAMGLSPATYKSASNVVPPTQKSPAPAGASAQDIMFNAGLQAGTAMSILQELMSGKRSVNNLPTDWDYELPRLLRPYLTPGTGAASKVSFNHTKTFHCADDPAMHKRPPAIGLAHELIHALHNSCGQNLALVKKDGENIEELITTGMPPYNFEELSDNKMRSQWPQHLQLRANY